MDFEFDYGDIDLPNFLALHLGNNAGFSVTMMPKNPELINIWERPYSAFRGNFPRFDRQLVDSKLGYAATRALYVARLCLENEIKPFWQLEINGEIYNLDPQMNFILHHILKPEDNEILYEKMRGTFDNPSLAGNSRKWNQIYFEDVEPGQSLTARKAIRKFIEEGYVVTGIYAHLNPRSGTSDHYYGRFECDGTLWVRQGKISLEGKAAGDFDPSKVPRIYPQDTQDTMKDELEKLIPFDAKQLSLSSIG